MQGPSNGFCEDPATHTIPPNQTLHFLHAPREGHGCGDGADDGREVLGGVVVAIVLRFLAETGLDVPHSGVLRAKRAHRPQPRQPVFLFNPIDSLPCARFARPPAPRRRDVPVGVRVPRADRAASARRPCRSPSGEPRGQAQLRFVRAEGGDPGPNWTCRARSKRARARSGSASQGFPVHFRAPLRRPSCPTSMSSSPQRRARFVLVDRVGKEPGRGRAARLDVVLVAAVDRRSSSTRPLARSRSSSGPRRRPRRAATSSSSVSRVCVRGRGAAEDAGLWSMAVTENGGREGR